MFDYKEVWEHLYKYRGHYMELANKMNAKIDYRNRRFYSSKDLKTWTPDSFKALITLVSADLDISDRKKDNWSTYLSYFKRNNMDKVSNRKDFEDYITIRARTQTVLDSYDFHFKTDNRGLLIIPSIEEAQAKAPLMAEFMLALIPDMFVYKKKKGRFIVDIYKNLMGVEISDGSNFLYVSAIHPNAKRPVYNEDKLNMTSFTDVIHIFKAEDSKGSVSYKNFVEVSGDEVDSIANVFRNFCTFDIHSDDTDFIKELLLVSESIDEVDHIFTIRGKSISQYIKDGILKEYRGKGDKDIQRMSQIISIVSVLPLDEHKHFSSFLKSKTDELVYSVLSPYMRRSNNSHDEAIYNYIGTFGFEFVAKRLGINTESDSLIYYSTEDNKFYEVTTSTRRLMSVLIPQLGGIAKIAHVCKMRMDRTRPELIQQYILQTIKGFIMDALKRVPVLDGFYSYGMYDTIEGARYNTGDKVYGKGLYTRSNGGMLFSVEKKKMRNVPTRRLSVDSAKLEMRKLTNLMKRTLKDMREAEMVSYSIASSIIYPLLSHKVSRPMIYMIRSNDMTGNMFMSAINKEIFNASTIINFAPNRSVLYGLTLNTTELLLVKATRANIEELRDLINIDHNTLFHDKQTVLDTDRKGNSMATIMMVGPDTLLDTIKEATPLIFELDPETIMYENKIKKDISYLLIEFLLRKRSVAKKVEKQVWKKIKDIIDKTPSKVRSHKYSFLRRAVAPIVLYGIVNGEFDKLLDEFEHIFKKSYN